MAQSPHLTPEFIERYRQRALAPDELLALDDHVADCEACRARLAEAERKQEVYSFLRADFQAEADEPTCLSYEQLAAYVDNTMDEVDREIAESHLEICPQCEQEVRDLRAFKGLMSTYPAQDHAPLAPPSWFDRQRAFWGRPFVSVPLGIAGAAAVALVAFWTTARPLRVEVANLQRQVTEERRKADALNREVATLPAWKSRTEQIQQAAERIRQENLRLQQANQRLQARVQPTPVPRAPNPEGPGPTRGGNRPPSSVPAETDGLHLALNDGGRKSGLDPAGRLVRVETYPPGVQAAWKTGKLAIPTSDIPGRGGILMGGPEDETTFAVRTPHGGIIESNRPTLSWNPLEGATGYKVYLFDERSQNESVESEIVSGTQWTVPQALKRGHLYRWEVVAYKDGEEIDKAPKPPDPAAKFKVLEEAKALELARARRAFGNSHLTMGVLYANNGLLEEAEREFQALVKANPKNEVARKLLKQVQEITRKAPE